MHGNLATTDSLREWALRRHAEALGLKVKGTRRAKNDPDHGKFHVLDRRGWVATLPDGTVAYGLDLDQLDHALSSLSRHG